MLCTIKKEKVGGCNFNKGRSDMSVRKNKKVDLNLMEVDPTESKISDSHTRRRLRQVQYRKGDRRSVQIPVGRDQRQGARRAVEKNILSKYEMSDGERVESIDELVKQLAEFKVTAEHDILYYTFAGFGWLVLAVWYAIAFFE